MRKLTYNRFETVPVLLVLILVFEVTTDSLHR